MAQTIQKYNDKNSRTAKVSSHLPSDTNDECETRGTFNPKTGQGGREKANHNMSDTAPRGNAYIKQEQTGSALAEFINKTNNVTRYNEPHREQTDEESQDYDDDLEVTTTKTMEGTTIQELPNEMLEYICYYLTYKDMSRLGFPSERSTNSEVRFALVSFLSLLDVAPSRLISLYVR